MNKQDSICYKTGFLKKENEIDNKWQKYFIRLTFSNSNDGLLTLYENENDLISKDSISLKNMTISNAHEMIMLSNINTAIFFCALDEKEALEWKSAISDAIEGVIRKREHKNINLYEYKSYFETLEENENDINIYQPLVSILKTSLLERVKETSELLSTSKEDLRIKMSTIGYRKSSIRSIYWKLFLGCIPDDSETSSWPTILNKLRNQYTELKNKYLLPNSSVKNNHDENYQEDFQSKKDFILTDILRTRSSDPFFKDQEVQNLMLRVLMVFAQEYPTIGYKQGMSDFLAIILLLVFLERYQWDSAIIPKSTTSGLFSTSYLCTEDMNRLDCLLGYPRDIIIIKSEIQEVKDYKYDSLLPFYEDLCNPYFIEHDCYVLLVSIMSRMLVYYTPDAPLSVSTDRMERKLSNIQNSLLCSVDQEITIYLNKMEIDPSMYLLRWLRLLFCREFQLDGVFHIWDAIFSETPDEFELSDYIAVAILVKIKPSIIHHEDMQTLLRSLKPFLLFDDAEDVIKMARQYRSKSGFYNILGSDSSHIFEEDNVCTIPKVWDSPPPQRTWMRLSDTHDLKSSSPPPLILSSKSRNQRESLPTHLSHIQNIENPSSSSNNTLSGPPQPNTENTMSPVMHSLQLPSHMYIPASISTLSPSSVEKN